MANLFDLPNITGGPDTLLVQLSGQVSIFPIMILFFTWVVIAVGGSMTQSVRKGYIDFPVWSTLAFITCDIMALIMSIAVGIIAPVVLGVLMGLTFFSGIWLFLTRGRFEN